MHIITGKRPHNRKTELFTTQGKFLNKLQVVLNNTVRYITGATKGQRPENL